MHHPILHVMHVLTDTNVGGAGTLLCNQLATFDRTHFTFTVVLPRGSRLAERIAALPLPCHLLYTEHGADQSSDWQAIGEYAHIFRTHRPDIVHTHAALSARIAAKICRVPVCIHTRHCVFPLTARQTTPLHRAAFRTANKLLSDGVIAVANAAKEQLVTLGMDEDDIRVIINGVQPLRVSCEQEKARLRQALALPENAFVVGMVARLEDYKGQSTLLSAIKLALQAEVDAPLYTVLCGEGSSKDALLQQAAQLGISHRVRFAGFCADVAPYYGIMNVNVNASYGTETSSLALSEGMSVGVPAIASDFGGNPYMIRDGYNGLLFPTKDAAALADALLTLYRDRKLLHTLGENARSFYAEHLTARGMTEQMEEYYRALYEQKKRGRRETPAAL